MPNRVSFNVEVRVNGTANRAPNHRRNDGSNTHVALKEQRLGWEPMDDPSPRRSMFGGLFNKQPDVMKPTDNLYHYLRSTEVERYDRWPGVTVLTGNLKGNLRLNFGNSPFGAEWSRRRDLAQQLQAVRGSMSWECDSDFIANILKNVRLDLPAARLARVDRRGELVFALDAPGFVTQYFENRSIRHLSPDQYLLMWLNGAVLQTAVSTFQTLLANWCGSQFWFVSGPSGLQGHSAFPEGYGTLVFAASPTDQRSFLVAVRPPSIYNGAVLREFAGDHVGGWLPTTGIPSEQVSLLRAQMYDECVQNGLHYWVATTLKYWIFVCFDHEYETCKVSPLIERNKRSPTVLQCLVIWMLTAVDSMTWKTVIISKRKCEELKTPRIALPYPPPPPVLHIRKPNMKSHTVPQPPVAPRRRVNSIEIGHRRRSPNRTNNGIATVGSFNTPDVFEYDSDTSRSGRSSRSSLRRRSSFESFEDQFQAYVDDDERERIRLRRRRRRAYRRSWDELGKQHLDRDRSRERTRDRPRSHSRDRTRDRDREVRNSTQYLDPGQFSPVGYYPAVQVPPVLQPQPVVYMSRRRRCRCTMPRRRTTRLGVGWGEEEGTWEGMGVAVT